MIDSVKLFEKTRNTYLIYSVIIFIISSSVIYFTLKTIVTKKQDEKLLWDKELIARKIKYEDPLPFLTLRILHQKHPQRYPYTLRIRLCTKSSNKVRNTNCTDNLTSVETLQGKTYRIITRSSLVRNQDAILGNHRIGGDCGFTIDH